MKTALKSKIIAPLDATPCILVRTYQHFVGFHWVHPQSKVNSCWGDFTLKIEQILVYKSKSLWKFLQLESVDRHSSARCYWDFGLCVSHEGKNTAKILGLDRSPSSGKRRPKKPTWIWPTERAILNFYPRKWKEFFLIRVIFFPLSVPAEEGEISRVRNFLVLSP